MTPFPYRDRVGPFFSINFEILNIDLIEVMEVSTNKGVYVGAGLWNRMPPTKFAFLVHLRDYREDLGTMARPFGWIPNQLYERTLRKRPLPSFIWSEVRIMAESVEPDGFIVMIPYSGKQLLEQKRDMLPVIRQAADFASRKGAKIIGLGGLTSPVTLGGKLLAGSPGYAVTNGNAFTALTIQERLSGLLADFHGMRRPKVAIVGATGSVGSLLCQLSVREAQDVEYLLIARNSRRLENLRGELHAIDPFARLDTSISISDICQADIVVLVTSESGCLLQPGFLKIDCVVLDATQPRNVRESLIQERPDVRVIDGGLVSVPGLKTNRIGQLGLPKGVSFACMAETMLLAVGGYDKDFSVGVPTLAQADVISNLAARYAHMGFKMADDHSFGKQLEPQQTPISILG